MFIFAWRISCMHCFYCILSLSVQWSQVFSSSFCGLHSSASQRLLCEMLSFQYDMTQTGVTSWRGSQPWLPTRQLKDITWCDAQISLFVLLYKAYRCMPFFWLIVFTFTLLKEHLPYLPSPTNSVGFRNPFRRGVRFLSIRGTLADATCGFGGQWRNHPNPWSCGFLEIQETGRSNPKTKKVTMLKEWDSLIFQLSISVLYTVHVFVWYLRFCIFYWVEDINPWHFGATASARQGSELLETLRALPQEAYEGMLGHSGVMLRGWQQPRIALRFFVFFLKVILIVEFHFITRLSVYWRGTQKAYILAIEGFVGSFRLAVCNWCNLCAFYIVLFLASAWSSCNSFIIGGVVGLIRVKWCGICKKTYCSKVAVSSCFI